MGNILIIKNADFSKVAVEVVNVSELLYPTTTKSLRSIYRLDTDGSVIEQDSATFNAYYFDVSSFQGKVLNFTNCIRSASKPSSGALGSCFLNGDEFLTDSFVQFGYKGATDTFETKEVTIPDNATSLAITWASSFGGGKDYPYAIVSK